jgi:hypothetical protein
MRSTVLLQQFKDSHKINKASSKKRTPTIRSRDIFLFFNTSKRSHEKRAQRTNQLNEWMRDEKTTSVPPSNGVISNFGFFSKHLLTDFVKMSIICII